MGAQYDDDTGVRSKSGAAARVGVGEGGVEKSSNLSKPLLAGLYLAGRPI